jgi:hypothetical protein
MSYRVRYRRRAVDQLGDIWLNAPDPNAVTAASARIDRLLRLDPLSLGESRDANKRFWVERPLAVTYRVQEADRKVVVLSLTYVRTKS